jgi:ABC-type multidrug transport system fused ATPase/permease subunit
MFADVVLQHKKFLALISFTGFTAVGLQAAGISLMYFYAKHLISGKKISLIFLSFNTRESIILLALTTACTALLFGAAALLNFYYNSSLVKCGCQLEKQLISKLYSLLRNAPTFRAPVVAGSKEESSIIKVALGDSRSCARAYLMAVSSIVPCLTLISSILVLVYQNWLMTVILIPLGVLFFLFVYRVNVSGVENSKAFEKHSPPLRDSFRDNILTLQNNTQNLLSETLAPELDNKIDDYVNSYRNLIALPYRSHLVTDIFLAVTLSSVLFGLSASAILGHSEWSNIIVYLIALRYATGALKQTSARFTVMNRFYPQLARYSNFTKSLKRRRHKNVFSSFQISGLNIIPSDTDSLEIAQGKPVLLFCKKMLSRYSVEQLIDAILNDGGKIALRTVAILSEPEYSASQQTNFHLEAIKLKVENENSTPESSLCRALAVFEDRNRIKLELQAYFDDSSILVLSTKAKLALQISSALDNAADWIFIDSPSFRLLVDEEISRFSKLFSKSFIVIYTRELLSVKDRTQSRMPCIVISPAFALIWTGFLENFFDKILEIKPHFIAGPSGSSSLELGDDDLDMIDDDF